MRARTLAAFGAQQRSSTRPSPNGVAPCRRSHGKRSVGTPPEYPAARPLMHEIGGTSLGAMAGSVAWITIAPVKGLALVNLDAVRLTARGVIGDRRFHV